jgi:trehalose 6-phosphate phosphatase
MASVRAMKRDRPETDAGRRSEAQSARPDRLRFSLARDAFLLDVDGTILDIAPTPEAVRLPASLRETLARLQRDAAVALVSGRAVAALDTLFAPLVLPAIGAHGAEWRPQMEGPVESRRPTLAEEVKRAFRESIADLPRVRIEDKAYTIAFHYRSAPERKNDLENRLKRIVASFPELKLLHGKSVIELKARDFDKGEAILDLMRTPAFADRRPVFLGDDTTDEDAFAAVRELGGVGISVGRPMPDTELMLPNPRAARLWLAALVAGSASI